MMHYSLRPIFLLLAFFFPLFPFPLPSSASAQSKLSPDLRRHLSLRSANKSASATDSLTVLIRTDNASALPLAHSLRLKGVKVVGLVPVDSLPSVSSLPEVVRVALPHSCRPRCNNSRALTRVDDVHLPITNLPMPYTGKDVTVCVIDGGFDFLHPAFSDADGVSRIKAFYSPYIDSGSPVSIAAEGADEPSTLLGSAFTTPESIAALAVDNTCLSHGTHVSGIAAGSRWNDFDGMAPDADLLLCSVFPEGNDGSGNDNAVTVEWFNDFYDPVLAHSLLFISDYVAKSGKPAVVNLSLGSQMGPHNGKGDMVEFFQDFIDAGIPMVIAAGNANGDKIHLFKRLSADNDTVKSCVYSQNNRVSFYVAGYSRQMADLSVALSIVNVATGEEVHSFPFVSSTADSDEDTFMEFNVAEDEKIAGCFYGGLAYGATPDDALRQTQIVVMGKGYITPGYAVAIKTVGPADAEIDFWMDGDGFTSHRLSGFSDGDDVMCCSEEATAPGAISVGAYVGSNVRLQTFDDPYTSKSLRVGDIASFSASGSSFPGISVPTVSAPGVNVTSSVSHFEPRYADADGSPVDGMSRDGFLYGSMSGTSMATPCVTGIIALWLEACPSLSPSEIKSTLVSSAIRDESVLASPAAFGAGKVDALGGLLSLLGLPALPPSSTVSVSPRSLFSPDAPVFDLAGRRVRQMRRGGFYISCGQKIINL